MWVLWSRKLDCLSVEVIAEDCERYKPDDNLEYGPIRSSKLQRHVSAEVLDLSLKQSWCELTPVFLENPSSHENHLSTNVHVPRLAYLWHGRLPALRMYLSYGSYASMCSYVPLGDGLSSSPLFANTVRESTISHLFASRSKPQGSE